MTKFIYRPRRWLLRLWHGRCDDDLPLGTPRAVKACFGEDASVQPGRRQEVMLHEAAVAWMRHRLSQTKPTTPWLETLDSYRSRLKACAAYINNKYDVDALCMALPRRLSLLEESWGDRIST